MTVLARELDEYQRALDTYSRQAKGFNSKQKAYQDSVLKDANGNLYLVNDRNAPFTAPPGGGALTAARVPWATQVGGRGYSAHYQLSGAYGYTATPENPDYRMVQTRNPDGSIAQNPGEWTKTQPNAPEFTRAAAQRMNRPSLAQQEGGLISDVIRTR